MECKRKVLVLIFLTSLILSAHSHPVDDDQDLDASYSAPTSSPVGKGHLPVGKEHSSIGKDLDTSYSAQTSSSIGEEHSTAGKGHSSIDKDLDDTSYSAPTSSPIGKEHSTVGKGHSAIGKDLDDTSYSAPTSSSNGKEHSTVGKGRSSIGKDLDDTLYSAPTSSPIGKEHSAAGKGHSSISKDLDDTSSSAPTSSPNGKEDSTKGKEHSSAGKDLDSSYSAPSSSVITIDLSVTLPPKSDESDEEKVIAPSTDTKTTTDSSSSSNPFAALESLFSTPAVQKEAPAPPEVVEACQKTDFPSECQATVMPSLEGKTLDSPIKILDSSVHSFTSALELAEKEIKKDKEPTLKGQKTVVNTCKEMYENAIEELKQAQKAADSGDKYGANIRFSAALTFIETCEDGLHGPAKESALATANKMLSKLASNNLALGNFALGLNEDDD